LLVAFVVAALVLVGGGLAAIHGPGSEPFMPHAHCYLFNRQLIALHGGSDLLIGLAYVAISATLTYLVLRARRELPFHWMMLSFALFIVACGATHFMEVWTLQATHPRYWLAGWVKLLTAVASVTTAIVLPPLIPRIRAVLEAARLAGERKDQLEKAYAELDALYRKVTQLDEMKTHFFSNVSHELRTPLSLIVAPVERLLQAPDLDRDSRIDLLMVRRNALMLHQHVNDLLDVSRLEAGRVVTQYSRIDLATLVRFIASAFDSSIAERRVSLRLDVPGELIAELDGDKLQRVLINLLANALKFVPEEGRVAISLHAEGSEAVLAVDDSGPGIRAELRAAVFERFHRGDAEIQNGSGGTGLGLSIVKEFVEMHGGTVAASESPLGGARFTVRLPLRAPAGTSVAESLWISSDAFLGRAAEPDGEEARWARSQSEAFSDAAHDAAAHADKPLVLVAEDNRDMNAFICRVLGKDVRTIAASDGEQAIELARARRPDLILTDMMMPKISGEELVTALRQEPTLTDVPIVLLTAKVDDEQKLSMLAKGAQDYLVKPFSIEELRARVLNQVIAKVTRDTLRRELDSQSKDLAQLARELSQRARELEGAKNDAEAANRAKDQFLAVLSHELRTPLTPALAAATNLEQTEDLAPQEVRESLSLIRRNIELEARLVDDLLDLTRISKGKLQIHSSTIDLHETIMHAAEMCRSEANNKGCELRLALDAADRHVSGDGARLAQVFWNLLLNAVKFTPAQGCIGVHTSNPAPRLIRIEVSDTGIGIDPEMISRIFEPFQQGEESTSRRFGGLGLGLSVAKGLVDAHSGTIAAHSDGKDRGATFTIELPTIVPPAAPKIATATRAPATPRSLRVLLVEDHADTRKALDRLLTRWGHKVTTAATVAHAVEAATAAPPDLLLSDVGLPDGTGMELLLQLRQTGIHVLAVAMSGYGMEDDLDQTRDAGFAEHLVKPVAAERLKEVIERLMP
jgi:signal transduction histidine kinase